MPQVNIQGIGKVNFPDDMTPDQIQKAIETDIFPSQTSNEATSVPQNTGYVQGRINAVKNFFSQAVNPQTYKDIGYQLTHFPNPGGLSDAEWNKLNTTEKQQIVKQDITNELNKFKQDPANSLAAKMFLSFMPVTPMSSASRAAMSGKALTLTPQQQALQAAQKAGYVVPPSEVRPNNLNIVESISGKAATRQGASQINQPITNALVRQELGIPKNTPITDNVLANVRKTAGQAYQAVKDYSQPIVTNPQYMQDVQGLSGDISQAAKEFPDLVKNQGVDTLIKSLSVPQMSSKSAVELSKLLRFKATSNLKAFDDPEKVALGMAQRKAAGLIEDLVAKNLQDAGQGQLATAWNNARTLIAKSHDVEAALKSNGNIDPKVFAKLIEKGKPLSGGLQTAGEFASHFPNAVQDVTKAGSPNVNNLRAMLSPLFAGGGAMVAGGPGAVAGGFLPYIASPLARSVLFSKAYQSGLIPSVSSKVSMFPIQRGLLALGAQDGLLGQ